MGLVLLGEVVRVFLGEVKVILQILFAKGMLLPMKGDPHSHGLPFVFFKLLSHNIQKGTTCHATRSSIRFQLRDGVHCTWPRLVRVLTATD